MKIVQVCPRYSPQSGGVETHVGEICERLSDRGHEVIVHTADASGEGKRRDRRNGVEIRRHKGLAPGGAFHLAPGIVPAVRRSASDVVHAHNYHAFPLPLAAVGVQDDRFFATTHYHGASPAAVRDRLLTAYRPIGRWALKRAETVIAVSEWERDKLEGDFDIESTVLPNGVNIERFTGIEPIERERPYLLTVGRLQRYKGVQHVIRSLRLLPEFDLLVVGDGPYRRKLKRLSSDEGLEGRVDFLGTVTDEELPSLYAGAEVYLLLSKFEAYGLTVGEALASGTASVVSNEMALSDWIGRPGVVGVDSFEPREVAEAVKRATSSTAVDVNLPTWDAHVERLERLYTAEQSDGKASPSKIFRGEADE